MNQFHRRYECRAESGPYSLAGRDACQNFLIDGSDLPRDTTSHAAESVISPGS